MGSTNLFPTNYKGSIDDAIQGARATYYAQFVLPQKWRKADGKPIAFEDVVAPYRYGTYGQHEVVFVTVNDEAFITGRMEADPYVPGIIQYHDIDIEFVGHRGYPYVLTVWRDYSYRPDTPWNKSSEQWGYGGAASGVITELLTFEEALKLHYFTDDDLSLIATKADEIRENPDLWHWSND